MRNEKEVIRKLPKHMNEKELRAMREILKKLHKVEDVKTCKHCKERMAERGISFSSIKEIFKYCTIEDVVETNVKELRGEPVLRMLVLSKKIYGTGEDKYRVGISVNTKTLEVVTVVKSSLKPHGVGIKDPGIDITKYIG